MTRGEQAVAILSDTTDDGLVYPLGHEGPRPGELIEVAPGVRWWRVPMAGPLRHINGFVLDDAPGEAMAIDTGMVGEATGAAWEAVLRGGLSGTRLSRILCTHLHPDHVGQAGWLIDRFGAALLMTRTEWLTLRMLVADARPEVPAEQIAFWRGAGWSEAQLAAASLEGWANFGRMVAPLPYAYTRIQDGETLTIGGQEWRVVVGRGHSPAHACLLDEVRGLLIAGDQVLPKISSNISLHAGEPLGDPLGDWLASIARFRELPGDVLVLPGHGDPFRGLHTRLDALAQEHRQRLDAIVAAVAAGPLRAVDCFALLFRRPIGADVIGMATAEAMAHLRRLEVEGRVRRETRDGVWWWG